MMKPTLGTNTTVFLLFFALSLLDAITSGDVLRSLLWFAIGLFFVRADMKAARRKQGW
jgi:hypothetical protein